MRKVILASSMLLALSTFTTGCQPLAGQSTDQIKTTLVAGQTTIADVKSVFGEPDEKIEHAYGNRTYYIYNRKNKAVRAMTYIPVFGRMVERGTDHTESTLNIAFNSAGVLEKYSYGNLKDDYLSN